MDCRDKPGNDDGGEKAAPRHAAMTRPTSPRSLKLVDQPLHDQMWQNQFRELTL